MEILNLGGSYEPSARAPKKKFKVLLGVGLLAAVMGMGSTLAASITLSSGNPVEFGQGIAATTACDSSLTVTPFSTYINRPQESATAADFVFSTVKISNIDTSTTNSSGVGCGGRYLVLKAYTDTQTAAAKYAQGTVLANPLFLTWKYTSGYVTGGVGNSGVGYNSGISIAIPSSGSTCTVKVDNTSADNAAVTCAMTAGAAGAASVLITFAGGAGTSNAPVASSAVAKLTLESNAADPSGWV
jgi:hypothetical protein